MEFGSRTSPGLLIHHGGWEARDKTGIDQISAANAPEKTLPKSLRSHLLGSRSKDEKTGNAQLLRIHVLQQLPWFVPVEDLPGEPRLCFLLLGRNGSNKSTTRKLCWNKQISAGPLSHPAHGALNVEPSAECPWQQQQQQQLRALQAGNFLLPNQSQPGAGIGGLNKYVPM